MTSRLRKKPLITAQTFLAKASSATFVALLLIPSASSFGQFTTRPISNQAATAREQVSAPEVGKPNWVPDRAKSQPNAGRPEAPQLKPDAIGLAPVSGWSEPRSLENTSPHLRWRAPHLRSDEQPRRLPGRPQKAAVASTQQNRLRSEQGASPNKNPQVRLVQQLEDLDLPFALQQPSKSFGQLKPVVQQSGGAEPNLSDIFKDDTSEETAEGDDVLRSRFQDQTPAGTTEEMPSPDFSFPETTEESRFDDPASDLAPPQEENSFDVGNLFSDDSVDTNADAVAEPAPESLPDVDLSESLPVPPTQPSNTRPLDRVDGDDNGANEAPKPSFADFNDEDCSAQAESCQKNATLISYRERKRISLDITPSIAPREIDMAKIQEVRNEKLSKAPSRSWRDRDGQILTDGSLEDYSNGRVIVRTVNGTQRSFAPSELSNEDWCFVTAWWELPPECRFDNEPFQMRDFRLTTFTWTAPGTCHKPLYFEEISVERYGHSAGPVVQPLVSGAHFFGNIVMLPYHMGLNPPNECQYTLGHYRPGDCAPWLVPGFPMSTRGFKWEGLAIGAAIALLP